MKVVSVHPAQPRAAHSVLLLVDVQSAFREHIEGFNELVRNVGLLVHAARRLKVPIVVSEQYPRGLGSTVSELAQLFGTDVVQIDKLEFNLCNAPGWAKLPSAVTERAHWIVVGIEAHVCVRQTALGLRQRGYSVHVPVDAVASRTRGLADVALQSLFQAGVHPASAEQVTFDWLETAGTDSFRDVQQLVRDHIAFEPAASARERAGR